jgi:hypothetical protein
MFKMKKYQIVNKCTFCENKMIIFFLAFQIIRSVNNNMILLTLNVKDNQGAELKARC